MEVKECSDCEGSGILDSLTLAQEAGGYYTPNMDSNHFVECGACNGTGKDKKGK